MEVYFVLVVFTAVMFGGVDALQCFECDDCRDGYSKVENVKTCNLVDTMCFKEIEDDGDINRGCVNAVTCLAKEAIPGTCVHEEVKPCFICCDSDKCNSATAKSVSIISACFALVTYLLFSFN